jgi:phosphoribosylamine--glycine ligase
MAVRGTPFAGLLYVGLALTAKGPMVVEFNARFGDPETAVILPLLETPLAGLLLAAATGRLTGHPPLRWRDAAAVAVVLASAGYPTAARSGDVIVGDTTRDGILHAGTMRGEDGILRSSGGRILTCTGVGSDLHEARARAYELVSLTTVDGAHYRHDIAMFPPR